MEAKDKLFSGCYPEGIVYADKTREEHGDWKKLAFLSYRTLELEFYGRVPADLKNLITEDAAAIQAKKGEKYSIAGNMKVTLGWGL